ncbi:rubrerythrin family protein [Niastella yeongjuensis]|uniref:Rubrerythrin family protein n=1 Tax=Niastella yeongjuensis TaxID=354355 RepID=A0A1V9F3C5_9BACT|nr:ferritin-like domain-containing protein [Niastella yeongjuensis]OQP52878.1 rubrerythrin family protein [Niastella yeongjuensis]SEP21641.1 Ferritin-like metal-binding protein YciE [Niastella yeongjuensis]
MAYTKSTSDSKSRTAGKSKNRTSVSRGVGKSNSILQTFFYESLKDIYWAEKQLTKALPKMQKAATTPELKAAIEEHIAQTKEQVGRLEEVFQLMERKVQAKKCDAMEGLIKKGESIIEETEDGTMTRDVGIIMAAQKVEHYEIATYGGLVQIATVLGEDEVVKLLNQTLEEEKETDAGLSEIAENKINWQAEQEGEEREEE